MNSNKNKSRNKTKIKEKTDDWKNEFLSSDGCIKSFREKLIKLHDKNGISVIVLEPGVFDYGVKRFGKKRDGYAVVYDYEQMAEALANYYLDANKDDSNYKIDEAIRDAYDWIDFNTLRSIPYWEGKGSIVPKVVFTDENGKERLA